MAQKADSFEYTAATLHRILTLTNTLEPWEAIPSGFEAEIVRFLMHYRSKSCSSLIVHLRGIQCLFSSLLLQQTQVSPW